jgi:hypothetical protein
VAGYILLWQNIKYYEIKTRRLVIMTNYSKERPTKKEMKQIRLQILKAEGPEGLKRFNDQYRVEGMPRGKQVHGNRDLDVKRGSSRKAKHRKRSFE